MEKKKPNKIVIEKLDKGWLLKYQTWKNSYVKHLGYCAVKNSKGVLKEVKNMMYYLYTPNQCEEVTILGKTNIKKIQGRKRTAKR